MYEKYIRFIQKINYQDALMFLPNISDSTCLFLKKKNHHFEKNDRILSIIVF